jgi:hypothetical protein
MKGKIAPVYAMMEYGGNISMAPVILSLGIRSNY